MSTPEYPPTLPGVSSLKLKTTLQVVVPDGDRGALEYRRITRVPSASGTVTFRFLEGDFAVFQQFYEVDLERGHKWFTLILPSAAGPLPHIVRATKHRVADSPGYGCREVALDIEIRGRRIYEDDREGEPGPETGGAYDIGWYEPVQDYDPASASTANSGTLTFQNNGGNPLFGGVVGTPPDISTLEWTMVWEPIIPDDTAPTFNWDVEEDPYFSITCGVHIIEIPEFGPFVDRICPGTAYITSTLDGSPLNGTLVVTFSYSEGAEDLWYADIEWYWQA